jgi:hypothetical protein
MYQSAEKVNRLLTNTGNIDTLWVSDKEVAPQVLEHPGARTTGSRPYGHNQCSSLSVVQDRG